MAIWPTVTWPNFPPLALVRVTPPEFVTRMLATAGVARLLFSVAGLCWTEDKADPVAGPAEINGAKGGARGVLSTARVGPAVGSAPVFEPFDTQPNQFPPAAFVAVQGTCGVFSHNFPALPVILGPNSQQPLADDRTRPIIDGNGL